MLQYEVKRKKKFLRVAAEKRRVSLSRRQGRQASLAIIELFFQTWPPIKGTEIAGFWPFRSEIDVRPLMTELHQNKCRVGLPTVIAPRQPLSFEIWTPDSKLKEDKFGVFVLSDNPKLLDPAILFVPLLAFDSYGNRLGYGGGYYDVTLIELRKRKSILAIGVAFEGQKVMEVPTDLGDSRLDAILTEQKVHFVRG